MDPIITAGLLMGGGSLVGNLFGSKTSEPYTGSKFMGLPIEDVINRYQMAMGQLGEPTTEPLPSFGGYPEMQTIAPEGWDALQNSIYGFGAGRLSEDRDTATNKFRATMRQIGMADDPSSFKLQEETIDRPYTRGLTDLALGATSQRYGLEAPFKTAQNELATQQAQWPALFGLQKYQASMQPFYAKAGVMNPMLAGGSGYPPAATQTTTPWAGIGQDIANMGMLYGML